MRYTFEEEFRLDHPETVGETDRHFDLNNDKDWLEAQLIEARKQLALYSVIGSPDMIPAIPPEDYNGSIADWMIALQDRGRWDGDGWYGDIEIPSDEWWSILEQCEGDE